MTNPAEALHSIYSEWRQRAEAKGQSATTVTKVNTESGVADIKLVFALLARIDAALERLEREGRQVGLWKRHAVEWARVPLFVASGWSPGITPDVVVTRNTLDLIEACSLFLDGKVSTYSEDERDSLRATVDRIDALLTDSELPRDLKAYLRRLTAETKYALDDHHAGLAFDFSDASDRLTAALYSAIVRAPDAEKNKWAEFLRDVTTNATGGALGGVATQVISAITQGLSG